MHTQARATALRDFIVVIAILGPLAVASVLMALHPAPWSPLGRDREQPSQYNPPRLPLTPPSPAPAQPSHNRLPDAQAV